MLMAFVVSHPFRKKKRKGWGTEHFSRQHSPRGPVTHPFAFFLAKAWDTTHCFGGVAPRLCFPPPVENSLCVPQPSCKCNTIAFTLDLYGVGFVRA